MIMTLFCSDLAIHFHGYTLDLSLPETASPGSHLRKMLFFNHHFLSFLLPLWYYFVKISSPSTFPSPLIFLFFQIHLHFMVILTSFLQIFSVSLPYSLHNNTPILDETSHSFIHLSHVHSQMKYFPSSKHAFVPPLKRVPP